MSPKSSVFAIRSAADHARALREIDRLMDAAPGSPEFEHLEILATLAEDYESRHHPIDPPDPVDAILFRMEQGELTRKDLESALGSRARVSEVLSRKRNLSIAMIRALHREFNIPLASLIGP